MGDFWASHWSSIQDNLIADLIWLIPGLLLTGILVGTYTFIGKWPKRVRDRIRIKWALVGYRKNRVAEWSRDRYGAGDRLFTQLSLWLDHAQDEEVRWRREKEKYDSLVAILKAHHGYPAFVLLGDPGSGKSTLMRRLDLDIANATRNSDMKGAFSYFVSLQDYRGAPGALPPAPMEWLRSKWTREWRSKEPNLPDLDVLLRGKSFLLLDALNEMPLRTPSDYRLLVDSWTSFIADVKTQFPNCRIVFSCRSLDYSAKLSNSDIRVPHVEIERLDEGTILKFLEHYAPKNAATVFDAIVNAGQLELYGTAFFLRMLCEIVGDTGQIPQDRSALFTAFVRKLLHREITKKTPILVTPGVLDAADLKRLVTLFEMPDPPWRSPYELPERGPLIPQLGLLAHTMQATAATSGNSQVMLPCDRVKQLLPDRPDDLIEASCALTILEHDRPKETVQFLHQLMQEYFAGRKLALTPEPLRARTPWLSAEIRPSLDEMLSTLNINEPLPTLDSTGWEETILLAAPMAADCGAFVENLIESNLPLAGRAAAQILASERENRANGTGAPRLPAELVARIQRHLLQRMVDPKADLRARIAAGKALGEVGDPRFTRRKDLKGESVHLVPPIIPVSPGTYQIGTEEVIHKHEGPQHLVEVHGFSVAQFPVTNAEWECFMRAGGYDDERWWPTSAAREWRKGETTRAARDAQWRAFRQMLRDNPDYVDRKLKTGEISLKAAEEAHYKAMKLSDAEFEAVLEKEFRESLKRGEVESRYTEPRNWRNREFNNPLQPVVGICWFEAMAYCSWLGHQTGQPWRLLTEAEWEVAARLGGPSGRRYPWGDDFYNARCNSFESHIRATTPVGIFPDGLTAAGLVDVVGNAYEWTSSKYDNTKYPYPYNSMDGREGADDGDDPAKYEPRVLRGGAWYYSKDEARIAFRLRFHPGYRNVSTGLRLALSE